MVTRANPLAPKSLHCSQLNSKCLAAKAAQNKVEQFPAKPSNFSDSATSSVVLFEEQILALKEMLHFRKAELVMVDWIAAVHFSV